MPLSFAHLIDLNVDHGHKHFGLDQILDQQNEQVLDVVDFVVIPEGHNYGVVAHSVHLAVLVCKIGGDEAVITLRTELTSGAVLLAIAG